MRGVLGEEDETRAGRQRGQPLDERQGENLGAAVLAPGQDRGQIDRDAAREDFVRDRYCAYSSGPSRRQLRLGSLYTIAWFEITRPFMSIM
jgi:hypothetical protein